MSQGNRLILWDLPIWLIARAILGRQGAVMNSPVRFGVFEVDLTSRELRKRGIRLHLPDQSFDILAMLVERPGDVITRDEIRDRLWPNGTVVEFEHSVSSAVQRLHERLGDSATAPRFIETLPRTGYRFVASVQTGTSAPSSPRFSILGELGQGGMGVVYRAEVLPAFSPDGGKIAFYSSRSGTWEIWVCDRDGSNAVQLTSLGGVDWDGATWSPDGRRIAFGLFTGGKIRLFVVNASGGIPQTLASDPSGAMFHPSWSRDGQSIYFRSGRGGQSEIWKMPAGGGESVQITRNTAELPQVSPDGKFLYFEKTDRYPKECSV